MQRFTNSVTNRSGDSLRGGGCFDYFDHFLLAFRSSPTYFDAAYYSGRCGVVPLALFLVFSTLLSVCWQAGRNGRQTE